MGIPYRSGAWPSTVTEITNVELYAPLAAVTWGGKWRGMIFLLLLQYLSRPHQAFFGFNAFRKQHAFIVWIRKTRFKNGALMAVNGYWVP